MADTRKKIFTEEDFDKEPRTKIKKTWYANRWIRKIIPVVVVVLCVVGYFIYTKSGNTGQTSAVEKESAKVENTSVASDTTNSDETAKEDTGDTESASVENNSCDATESAIPVEPAKPAKTETTKPSADASVKTANVSSDIEAEAMKVIRGDYGIGQERKNKLGEKYQTIQNRVNELKREGLF